MARALGVVLLVVIREQAAGVGVAATVTLASTVRVAAAVIMAKLR